jgi:hypothetical protein
MGKFLPGNNANPYGRGLHDRIYTDAIRVAVHAIDPETGKRKIRAIAERVVKEAMNGNLAAAMHIADRLDGKPPSEATLVHYRNPQQLCEFTDEELVAMIREGSEQEALQLPGPDTKKRGVPRT